jgi:biotin operon repressor
MESKARYLNIPYNILKDKNLKGGNERIIFAEIVSLCKLGQCYATQQQLGDLCGISRMGANKIIRRLCDIGYISTEPKDRGRGYLIYVNSVSCV